MSRVLSLLAAVVLVAGAMILRDRLERRAQADTVEATALSVTCATELAAACERLEESGVTVRVEPAGDTVAALAGDQADGPDLWLVLAPWPEIPQARGATARPDVSGVLARSPLVLAGFAERLDALEPACGGPVTWRCVGEQAGTPWRDLGVEEAGPAVVRPGHLDPSASASGLLVAGAAVTSFAGGATWTARTWTTRSWPRGSCGWRRRSPSSGRRRARSCSTC